MGTTELVHLNHPFEGCSDFRHDRGKIRGQDVAGKHLARFVTLKTIPVVLRNQINLCI